MIMISITYIILSIREDSILNCISIFGRLTAEHERQKNCAIENNRLIRYKYAWTCDIDHDNNMQTYIILSTRENGILNCISTIFWINLLNL